MGGEDGCDGSVGTYTVFCVTDSDDEKQRNNNHETIPSRLSLNRKQRSLLGYVICVQCMKCWLEFGIINIWTKCQFIWSGKVCIWLWQPVVSTSSCMLRIEKLITFNMICMWTFHTLQTLVSCFIKFYKTLKKSFVLFYKTKWQFFIAIFIKFYRFL